MAIDNSTPLAASRPPAVSRPPEVSRPTPTVRHESTQEVSLRLRYEKRARPTRFLLKALEASNPEEGELRVLKQLHGHGKIMSLTSKKEQIRYFVFSPDWIMQEDVVTGLDPECVPGPESRAKRFEKLYPTVLLLRSPDEQVLGQRTEGTIRSWLGRNCRVIVLEYPGEGESDGRFRTRTMKAASAAMLQHILGEIPISKCLVEGVGGGVIPATFVAAKFGVALLLRNPDAIDGNLVWGLQDRMRENTLRSTEDKVAKFGKPAQFLGNISKLKGPLAVLIEDGMTGKGAEMRRQICGKYSRLSSDKQTKHGAFAPLFDQSIRKIEQHRQLKSDIAFWENQINLLRAEGLELRAEAVEAETLCPPAAELPTELRKRAFGLSYVRRDLEAKTKSQNVLSSMLEDGSLRIEDLELPPLQYSSSRQFSDALNTYLRLLGFLS